MKTAIIGGVGGMGQLIAREYINHRDLITITGPNLESAIKVANNLGVRAATNEDAIKNSDEIIIAVNLLNTIGVLEQYKHLFTADKIIYDIASVKYLQSINASIPNILSSLEARTLSTHPMLGPDSPEFKGYNIVLIPTRDDSPIDDYKSFFGKDLGANVMIIQDEDTHDKYIATILGLGHMLGYIWAEVTKAGETPLNELLQLSGSTFLMNTHLVRSVLFSSPGTYAAIQIENKYSLQILKLIDEGVDHFRKIISDGDYTSFFSEIKGLQEYLKSQGMGDSPGRRESFAQAVAALK